MFDWIHNDNKHGRKGEKISAMWSTDSGETWSDPVVIDPIAGAVLFDTRSRRRALSRDAREQERPLHLQAAHG